MQKPKVPDGNSVTRTAIPTNSVYGCRGRLSRESARVVDSVIGRTPCRSPSLQSLISSREKRSIPEGIDPTFSSFAWRADTRVRPYETQDGPTLPPRRARRSGSDPTRQSAIIRFQIQCFFHRSLKEMVPCIDLQSMQKPMIPMAPLEDSGKPWDYEV